MTKRESTIEDFPDLSRELGTIEDFADHSVFITQNLHDSLSHLH